MIMAQVSPEWLNRMTLIGRSRETTKIDLHDDAMSALMIAAAFDQVRIACNEHPDIRLQTEGGQFTSTGYAGSYGYASDGMRSILGAIFGVSTAELIYQRYILESGMPLMEAVECWQRDAGFID